MTRIFTFFIVLLLFACDEENSPMLFTEQLNAMTPVKDQGDSQTCWIYAMLAAIETEQIGRAHV